MKYKDKVSYFLYFQRCILFLWIITMPIMLVRLSPVNMVFSAQKQIFSLGILFLIIWFVSSLFFGRMYCSFGCPLGAGQEVAAKLISKRLSQKGRRKRRNFRYLFFILWFGVIVFSLLKNGGFKEVNLLFSAIDDSAKSRDQVAIIVSMIPYFIMSASVFIVLTLLIGNRAACNYFCPMNVLGIIGTKIKNALKYPSLHLECNSSACNGCRRCSNACQMSIEVHQMVNKGDLYDEECIMCGSCIEACSKNAIYYSWKSPKKG